MKMTILLGFGLLVWSVCFSQKVIHDPNAEVRAVEPFHAIHVSGNFKVYLTQGSVDEAVVSADKKELINSIRSTVEGGVLHLKFAGNTWKHHLSNGRIRAYVSVKNLDELKASDACLIEVEGQFSMPSFNLELSGASDLKGALEVQGLFRARLSGASDVKISGSADLVDIEASGASEVKGADFVVASCTIKATGACDIKLTVNKEVNAQLSGASSFSYKGSGEVKEVKTYGASSMKRY